jgi:hypothetical protein
MRKFILLLTLLIIVTGATQASAQSYYRKQTSLYLEIFGNGGELSANIEKLLGETISLHVGGGLTGVVYRKGFVVPFGGSLMFGGRQNKLEFGVGGAWVDIDDNGTEDTFLDVTEDQWVANGIAGFRFLGDYGFTFRLAYTPAYTQDGLQHMGGAILGKSF